MVDIANSITINRPAEDVFAYVTDLSNEPAWHTDLLEARRTSEGPVGIGTRYQVRFKPFMGNSEGTEEVIGFEPNRLQVVRGEVGPMRPTITYLVEPANGGTRFTRRLQLEASGHDRTGAATDAVHDREDQRRIRGEPQARAGAAVAARVVDPRYTALSVRAARTV